MSDTISLAAARLQQQVPAAEARIDDAIIAASSLMTSVVTARRDTPGVPAVKAQSTIHRIARLQTVLVGASGDALRNLPDRSQLQADRRCDALRQLFDGLQVGRL